MRRAHANPASGWNQNRTVIRRAVRVRVRTRPTVATFTGTCLESRATATNPSATVRAGAAPTSSSKTMYARRPAASTVTLQFLRTATDWPIPTVTDGPILTATISLARKTALFWTVITAVVSTAIIAPILGNIQPVAIAGRTRGLLSSNSWTITTITNGCSLSISQECSFETRRYRVANVRR